MKRANCSLPVWCLMLPLALAACSGHRTIDLPMKTLFTIPIGKGEGQLDLLEQPGVASNAKIRLAMQNGLFYIGNGSADKVMEFSSYGDILSLLYNPDTNPPPVLLASTSNAGNVATREAHRYPLHGVGEVAVSENRMLLVQEQVSPERQEFDAKLGAILDNVVLRFNENGELIDYLGQEGVGGTPFPYIERVQTNSQGEMMVITRTPREWIVFWYNVSGELLYKIEIGLDNLPVPDRGAHYLASLESIYADPSQRTLYLKIDYYVPDPSGAGLRGNVDFAKSSVFWLNVDTQKYEGHVDLPKNILERNTGGFVDSQKVEVLYQLVGVARGGYLYLLSPLQDNYYELLVIGKGGRVIHRSRVTLDDRDIAFRTFYLTPSGILCALLVHSFNAQVVWWRSDRLIEGRLNEGG